MYFSNQIKLVYHALKTKLHFDEIAAGTVEVIQHTHRHVMHTIEAIATRIPPLMLLVESIGHIAAITQFRLDHPNKKALGFKVTTGLIMLGVGITALALPQISIPLVIAGLACELSYQFFSIYHIHHKICQLQTTLKSLPQQNIQQHQTVSQQLNKLQLIYREQRQQRTEKIIRSAVSVVVLIAVIAVFANPITAIPATLAALCATSAYLTYHFCKPLLQRSRKHSTAKPDDKDASTFLKSDVEILEKEALTQAQHTPKEAQIAQFLNHEDEALAKILQPKPEPIPQQKAGAKPTQEKEEDEDGDAGERDTITETEETVELISE